MRSLVEAKAVERHLLIVTFGDGICKQVDVSSYLQSPAFTVLLNEELFKSVICREYFIEWPDQELDISADTLWHLGKEV